MMDRMYGFYPVLRECAHDWPLEKIFRIKIDDMRKNMGREQVSKKRTRGKRSLATPSTPAASPSFSSIHHTIEDDTAASSGASHRAVSPRIAIRSSKLGQIQNSSPTYSASSTSHPQTEYVNLTGSAHLPGPEKPGHFTGRDRTESQPLNRRNQTHASRSPSQSPSLQTNTDSDEYGGSDLDDFSPLAPARRTSGRA